MPEDTLIRQRLAELIRGDGRSQAELSRAAGILPGAMNDIVRGRKADLRGETIARLAHALGLSPTALGKLMYDCFNVSSEAELKPK